MDVSVCGPVIETDCLADGRKCLESHNGCNQSSILKVRFKQVEPSQCCTRDFLVGRSLMEHKSNSNTAYLQNL